MAGASVNNFLQACPFWMELKTSAKAKGEVLASYSFRHRYAFAVDDAGFNDRLASKLMGNSRETFIKSYGDKARDEEILAAAEQLLADKPQPVYV